MLIPRIIVFDLDGTLLDTSADITASCNHALTAAGRSPRPREEMIRFIGDGARKLCARAADLSSDDDDLDPIVDAFVTHYMEHYLVATKWMPQAPEALSALKSVRLAVCTNKPRTITDRILESLGVTERFQAVVGGGDVACGKPAPDSLLLISERLEVEPGEMVMVGDGVQDVLAGRAAGTRTIALSTGYATKEALLEAEPDILLDSLIRVPDIIRRWREATVRVTAPRV